MGHRRRRRPQKLKDDCERKLYFVDYAETLTISARTRQGLDKVMTATNRAAYTSAFKKLSTLKLTRVLQDAIVKQQPPRRHHTSQDALCPSGAAIRR